MEPSIDFARIDCSLTHELCEELKVVSTPSMIFLPAEGVEYNNTFPRLPTVDSIVLYLNEIVGTHRTVDGGLDDMYGLNEKLNVLADEFMSVGRINRVLFVKRLKKTAFIKGYSLDLSYNSDFLRMMSRLLSRDVRKSCTTSARSVSPILTALSTTV